jgi:membrane-associated phospholipid phosphatase
MVRTRVSPRFWPQLLLRSATVISSLGHPLLTGPLFLALVSFRLFDAYTAGWISGGLLGLVIAPIALWNYRQTRSGAYSNFDVSERKQRLTFYPRLIGLLLLALAILTLAFPASTSVRDGLGLLCLMLAVCFGLNFLLKVSLHAAISFFLASALCSLKLEWGVGALIASAFIAASRLVLRRHTLSELVAGAAIGLCAGTILVLLPAK